MKNKLYVRKKGNVTITIGKDLRDELMFLKIKSDKKSLDAVLRDLLVKAAIEHDD